MSLSLQQVKGRRVILSVVALSGALLAGCAAPPIPTNYAPSSVMSANGALSIADFKYLPAESTAERKVASNVIRNTAIGTIEIDRDVNKYIRDAVFAELRFVGIKTNDNSQVLSGEIQEFLIDDLGYSVDWTLRIKYVITDAATKAVTYDAVKETKRKTAKFVNTFGAMNETVKLNVEDLLNDARFQAAIATKGAQVSAAR